VKKNIVITRADRNVVSYAKITLPLIKQYAQKCDADFMVLSHEPPIWTEDHKPHYRILEVANLLDQYERVLHLDSDVLINKNCPNLFDVVAPDMVGIIYEDKGSREADRRYKIQQLQNQWGDIGWREGYTNAGTFVVSREHKNIFAPHEGQYYLGWGSADLHMAYNINKYQFKVHELEYKWNHMTMFSHSWNNFADRFQSHIIHYAGKGVFDAGVNNKVEQMKLDYERIYG
jgi:hypothetical protein